MNQGGEAVLCELEDVEKEAHSLKIPPNKGRQVPVFGVRRAGTRPSARVGLAVTRGW